MMVLRLFAVFSPTLSVVWLAELAAGVAISVVCSFFISKLLPLKPRKYTRDCSPSGESLCETTGGDQGHARALSKATHEEQGKRVDAGERGRAHGILDDRCIRLQRDVEMRLGGLGVTKVDRRRVVDVNAETLGLDFAVA